MKKIWFGIGAVVIIILLLLQTRFNIYMQLDDDGYAIQDKTVKTLLMANPDEDVEEDTVPLCQFKPLDYIYTRGNTYYLGEEKKVPIDMSFPLLINGGAGVWFEDDSATLFDIYYDEYTTYRGLTITERISYNPGGDRAAADEYLFAGLKNGYFINLDGFSVNDNGMTREVSMNSIINFTEDYFIYCEQEEEQLRYQIVKNIPQNALVTVNGEELTYHQLLLNLRVITDKKEKINPDDEQIIEETVPTPEVLDVADKDQIKEDKDSADNKKNDVEKPDNTKKEKEPKSSAKSQSKKSGSSGGRSTSASAGTKGVRPDSMRGDKSKTEKEPRPKEENYVKPEVTINGVTAGVYRISLDVKVADETGRILPTIGAQFEFRDTATGELVIRTYTTGSNPELTVSDGKILPEKTYKITGYFTYRDEYGDIVTESIVINPGEVTTLGRDKLGPITIKIDPATFRSIPDNYDSYVLIKNVVFTEDSNEEAIFGLDPRNVTMKITGRDKTTFDYTDTVDRQAINLIKRGTATDIQSSPVLAPSSKYTYEIIGKDYGGYTLTINNNIDNFETCKSRPVGEIVLENADNELGNTKPKYKISDPDAASIKPDRSGVLDTDRDIYFVISTEKDKNYSGKISIWDKIDSCYKNGRTADNTVHYVKKLAGGEYSVNASTGALTVDLTQIIIGGANSLDLNTKYYAYLVADYCLENKKDENGKYINVYHGNIGSLEFRTAGLSSLGNVYIDVGVSEVKAHSAKIVYKLNTDRTNDRLEEYISNVRFDINTRGGAELQTHSTLRFDRNTLIETESYMTNFTGWEWSGSTWTKSSLSTVPKSILMDVTPFFDRTNAEGNIPCYLNSMQEYSIDATVMGLYNGKEYPLTVRLTTDKFKTLKEPAHVDVQDVIFAAGTLKFKVRIDDPDGTIIGNSGHVVVMNIYDSTGKFIRAIRIPKNTFEKDADGQYILDSDGKKIPSYVSQMFTGLDPSLKYVLQFVATEYNEGYTLATYESNKTLLEYRIEQSLDITGTIKLQHIDSVDDLKMKAYTFVDIRDKVTPPLMSNEYPYYIRVERDGKDVTSSYPSNITRVSDYTRDTDGIIQNSSGIFDVDKGNHTYKLTLYLNYNNNELVLDTLTFTTEKPVIQISSCEEFVRKIKENGRNEYKYCVTGNLDFVKYDEEQAKSGSTLPSSSNITSVFNGEIDFQGFTVTKNKKKDGDLFFNNIGPTGEIYNAVFEFSDKATNNIYDEGVLTNRNYGHIHDVIVNYRGGSGGYNQYYGLLCRINTASGIIERFVVNNCPEEGTSTFTARNRCGLVCGDNYGTVRYGYVYGDDINTIVGNTSVGGDIHVGGIAGYQSSLGRMYDVYSLVNIVVSDPDRVSSRKNDTMYGAIIGGSYGSISNAYSVGVSLYNKNTVTDDFYKGAIGPALGVNNKNSSNVYYWNEQGYTFTNGKYQKRIALESLYDYSWQGSLLGGSRIFDATPVEVGYYPHVIMSDELPEQEYIPLPGRTTSRIVDIVSSEFVKYANEEETEAIIKFRFSNPRNAAITGIDISNLTTTVLGEQDGYEITSVDGYTVLYAKVSNPTAYLSSYEINKVTINTGSSSEVRYDDPKPVINVDFYRLVTNPVEWYDFVVKKPTENAKLGNDIDFSGITMDRIRVTSDYTGKLDGGKNGDNPYGFTLKNIEIYKNNTSYTPCVFNKLIGEINGVCVENLTIKMSNRNNGRAGFVGTVDTGSINNVHLINVNVEGIEYIGSLVGYMNDGSVVENCSASGNVIVKYIEPANTNTDGAAGGLVGYSSNGHIRNCFVTDLDLSVPDIKNCRGAAGIVGWSNNSALENLYASGKVDVRGVNVGGIVGYHSSSETSNVMKNLISRVDVSTYQDMVGGIAGTFSLSQSPIDPRNNMTGVAFGNVFCKNSSSTNVSYTIGFMNNYKGTFYGSDFQLINGMVDTPVDANTAGLISYSQAQSSATYTDSSLLHMDSGVYNYSYVEDTENGEARPHLPHLYYYGSGDRYDSSMELPFQKLINISEVQIANNLVNVRSATVNTSTRVIRIEVVGPKGYTITGFKIDELEYSLDKNDLDNQEIIGGVAQPFYPNMPQLDDNGTGVILLKYKKDSEQKHFFDSYNLMNIEYRGTDTSGNMVVGSSDYSANPVRIPLTLYKDIRSMDGQTDGWNTFINATEARNYGNYENYRIDCKQLNFSGAYTKNTKLGRLVGVSTSQYEKPQLTNIKITNANENFIFRLNSEMSGLEFKDCTIDTKGRQCAGLIGSSAGEIYRMDFNNINIKNSSNHRYAGIIGFQTGGCLGKENNGAIDNSIKLNGITVQNNGTGDTLFCGGLVGMAQLGTKFANIEANNITVLGDGYVGGIAGGTEKAFFENINASNVVVESRQAARVGGIVGSYTPGEVNSAAGAYFVNVHLTGTPSKYSDGDKAGFVQSSNTTVSMSTSGDSSPNYIGGLVGYTNCFLMGRKYGDSSSVHGNSVDGVVVKGLTGRIGGMFGYCLHSYNGKVSNVLITTPGDTTGVFNGVGGICGENAYQLYMNETKNVLIDMINHGYVGLTTGYKSTGSYTMQYNLVENSMINLSTSSANVDKVSYVGGSVGYAEGPLQYHTVYNTKINANNINYVGGITGFLNHNQQRCFYYAEPAGTDSPQADDAYVVKGRRYVGGIVGYHNTGEIHTNYSNANVIAETYNAGGVDGLYRNNYTVTVVSGKNNYTYSTSSMKYCYFAGSVQAQDNAGGLIGDLGMASRITNNAAVAANGGRRSAAADSLIKTGSGNEVDYTYCNMCLASYVKVTGSGATHAFAFAGNCDGFEGKANRYNASGENFAQDASGKDKADRTLFWEGMKLITSRIIDDNAAMLLSVTTDRKNDSTENYYDATPEMAKNTYNNGNNQRYISFKREDRGNYIPTSSDKSEGYYQNKFNVRLVSQADLETHYPYYAMGLKSGKASGWKGASYSVLLTQGVTIPGTYYAGYNTDSNAYLPSIRVNNNDTINDYLVRYQTSRSDDGSKLPIKLPVPHGDFSSMYRMMLFSMWGSGDDERPLVYASDIDKINIEFGALPEGSSLYYKLYYGDTLVDTKIVEHRVYTYDYDFKKAIRIEYGYAYDEWYQEEMSSQGLTLGTDYELIDCLENAYYYWCMSDYDDEGLNEYSPAKLSHHVMTYGDKYYYINSKGIVSGTGNGSNGEESEDGSDPTAEVFSGKFTTIYNGKALSKDGDIYDVTNNSVVRKVTKGMKESKSIMPLLKFSINNSGIETYWKHTDICSAESITREAQILKSRSGNVSILPASINTVKDSAVLYTKDGNEFLTVLEIHEDYDENTTVMIDMYQGENINAPEDFKTSGIVYMTNNFYTTAPFILVEYQNGGIVGYNYMTGKYLFDYSVHNYMDLLDYAKVYFEGEKSELLQASRSYAAVSKVAEIASSPERLLSMVQSAGMINDDEDTNDPDAETYKDEESDKIEAGDEKAKAGDNRAISKKDNVSGLENTSSTEYVDEENRTGGDTKNTLESNSSESHVGVQDGNENNAGSALGNGILGGSQGLDGETSLNTKTEGGGNPITNLEEGITGGNASGAGEGTGEGELTGNGTLGGSGLPDLSDGTDVGGGDGKGKGDKLAAGDGLGAGDSVAKQLGATRELVNPANSDNPEELDLEVTEVVKDKKDSSTTKEEEEKEGSTGTTGKTAAAGEVSEPSGGLNKVKFSSDSRGLSDESDKKEDTETVENIKLDEQLMLVFNAGTGTYELLDIDRFMSDATYVSENARLGVKDFSAYGGYATEKKQDTDEKQKRGMWLYILAVIVLLSGIGGGIYYKKKHNVKI